ncbi:DUF4189 domain-containing protein [Shewanella sp. 125m-1]
MKLKIFLSTLLTSLLSGCVTPTTNIKDYDIAVLNKAFAVSTNGVLGAAWGQLSTHVAIDLAIKACNEQGGTECKVIDINGRDANSFLTYKSDNRVIDAAQRIIPSVTDKGIAIQYRCSDLTRSFAFKLLSHGHSYLDKDGDGIPCEFGLNSYNIKSRNNCHWVNGYTRKNGSYVKGHMRCR